MKVKLSIAWALGQEVAQPLDNRLLECLQAVEDAGSLGAAARRLDLSYRHLWGLLERWERQCGATLMHLQRGRGAQLAPLGRALLDARRLAHSRLAPDLERLGDEAQQLLAASLGDTRHPPLKITASHDLSLSILRELLSRETHRPVELRTRGSLDSLRDLAAGGCDLAGFHISEPLWETHQVARLRDLLDSRRHRLVRLVARHQGLMVAAGNPLKLNSLAGVADRHGRFINRQPGSGTRLLVDGLLEQAGIDPATITGYDDEEFTHLAVAAMVASGAADAGFGIEAAARQFSLEFVPVLTEQYWLAVDTRSLPADQRRVLVAILQSAEFKRRIAPLLGYNSEGAGEQVPLERVFTVSTGTGVS